MLERILDRENLNRAYKRVRANKGAPGIDGMNVEGALEWLKEHGEELLESIRSGKYKPSPVRRKEIPKGARLRFQDSGMFQVFAMRPDLMEDSIAWLALE